MNFKHKFLNNLFPSKDLKVTYPIWISFSIDLKLEDYLLVANADEFNAEIKLLAKEKYIESSMYISKKKSYIESSVCISTKKSYTFGKKRNLPTDDYRSKQTDIASAVFQQESLPNGLIIYLSKSSSENFSFWAVAILKESLPFEYLISGNQMRNNIEYELQSAKKQRAIDYNPLYDRMSFK